VTQLPGDGRRPRAAARRAALFVAASVLAFWVVVSGSLRLPDLAVGIVVALLLGGWSVRFLWSGAAPAVSGRLLLALPAHLVLLAGEVALAALHVARLVLDPRLPIRPRLVQCRTDLRSPAARTTFALSLTLTPGTLAVDAQGGCFLVHCLDEDSARRLLDGALERRVARMFGEDAA
jgi:multicomponent Na+:H+ antiporter subunit E